MKKIDNHIKKSVPGYDEGHDLITNLIPFFIGENGSKVFDIGCSTGTLLKKIRQTTERSDVEFIGIDIENEMIKPFIGEQKADGNISYGLSSFGYDVRVSDEFKIFTDVNSAIVDPKNFKQNSFVSRKGKECIIPPNSFTLASTVEYFKIPKNILVICLGKSTYARCGIIVNVTPLEPGWEGHVTLEFSNTTPLPAKIYANEGAAQFIFLQGNEEPEKTYAQRKGKYMKQTGVTLPKV